MKRCAALRPLASRARVAASPWCVAAVALAASGPAAQAKGVGSSKNKGSSHGDGGSSASSSSVAAGAPTSGPTEFASGAEESYCGAPYLRLYFDAVTRATTEYYQSMVETGSCGRNREGLKKVRAALDEARPLLERSFRHHDSNGDGVLDGEEAQSFFAHIVSEEGGLIEAVYTGVSMKYMQKVILEADDSGACEAMELVGANHAMLRAKLETHVQHYLQNKDNYDEAAFTVCDVDRSGSLELHEVVNALDPLHPRNDLFAQALGFNKEYKDLAAAYIEIEHAAANRCRSSDPATSASPSDPRLWAKLAITATASGIVVVGILVQRCRRCQ